MCGNVYNEGVLRVHSAVDNSFTDCLKREG